LIDFVEDLDFLVKISGFDFKNSAVSDEKFTLASLKFLPLSKTDFW
jgi:hypothetical protein